MARSSRSTDRDEPRPEPVRTRRSRAVETTAAAASGNAAGTSQAVGKTGCAPAALKTATAASDLEHPKAAAHHPAAASPAVDRGDDTDDTDDTQDGLAADLSFREAQTALELSLAQLQASDLDVEAMAGLYRRACSYADRCEQVLMEVEQEVMAWDPLTPEQPPQPFQL